MGGWEFAASVQRWFRQAQPPRVPELVWCLSLSKAPKQMESPLLLPLHELHVGDAGFGLDVGDVGADREFVDVEGVAHVVARKHGEELPFQSHSFIQWL